MSAHKNITDVNDGNFKESIADGVKLVDFWAGWCMPCRMQTPILEKLGAELDDRAKILALDVDQNPNTAQANNITGIPALHLYKNGELQRQFVGVQSPDTLKEAIEALL